jgi:hypothetical protein
MNTVYEAEGRKKVLYFSGTSGMRDYSLEEIRYGGRDGFSHLPYHDPWDERNTFQYASTLSTAPRDLLKPVDGYSPNSEGYTYVAKDVPGGVIMADNTRRQSKMLEKT